MFDHHLMIPDRAILSPDAMRREATVGCRDRYRLPESVSLEPLTRHRKCKRRVCDMPTDAPAAPQWVRLQQTNDELKVQSLRY